MTKNTTTVTNEQVVTLEGMIAALHAESTSKEKQEKSGSKRRAIALQLALAYPETLAQWKREVSKLGTEGDQRDEARIWAAAVCEADGYDSKDKTNHVNRFIATITFAVDVIALGYANDVTFNTKGGAFIGGNTTMAQAIWTFYDWNGKKNMQERDVSQQITIVSRNNERAPGSVSWAMLEDFVKTRANRKSGARVKPSVVSVTKPLDALRVISNIASEAEAVHFSTKPGKLQSINTAEDILALGLEGDMFSEDRAAFAKLFDSVREKLGMVREVKAA